jgi:hypothetical protein
VIPGGKEVGRGVSGLREVGRLEIGVVARGKGTRPGMGLLLVVSGRGLSF